MGKGDMKTRRGKIFRGTYGRLRPRRKVRIPSKSSDQSLLDDMVRFTTMVNKKSGESIRIIRQPDEYTTKEPRKYFRNAKVSGHMYALGVPHEEMMGNNPKSEKGKKVFIEAMKLWNEKELEIDNTNIPEDYISLLSTTKKSDQVKLLKGKSLTPDLLSALIFKANEEHGYGLRHIRHDIPQKGVETEKMPASAIVNEDGSVNKIGKTDLSDGQIKQAVEHRKVTIAKFLEKDDQWHCLFTNFKSLGGKESWEDGQPHYHYISDSFGISKEEVIKQLKSDKYNLGNLPHIKLEDYGKQPTE